MFYPLARLACDPCDMVPEVAWHRKLLDNPPGFYTVGESQAVFFHICLKKTSMVIPLRTERRVSVLELPRDLSQAYRPLQEYVDAKQLPAVDTNVYLLN